MNECMKKGFVQNDELLHNPWNFDTDYWNMFEIIVQVKVKKVKDI